jgi:hypothetical protein
MNKAVAREAVSEKNLVRSALIVGYILIVLLISGLARAKGGSEEKAAEQGFSLGTPSTSIFGSNKTR